MRACLIGHMSNSVLCMNFQRSQREHQRAPSFDFQLAPRLLTSSTSLLSCSLHSYRPT